VLLHDQIPESPGNSCALTLRLSISCEAKQAEETGVAHPEPSKTLISDFFPRFRLQIPDLFQGCQLLLIWNDDTIPCKHIVTSSAGSVLSVLSCFFASLVYHLAFIMSM